MAVGLKTGRCGYHGARMDLGRLIRHVATGSAELVVGEAHTAPRAGSGRVRASATVIAVEGRIVTLAVEARDELERIGGGEHRRVVVDVERFDERVARKRAL